MSDVYYFENLTDNAVVKLTALFINLKALSKDCIGTILNFFLNFAVILENLILI